MSLLRRIGLVPAELLEFMTFDNFDTRGNWGNGEATGES